MRKKKSNNQELKTTFTKINETLNEGAVIDNDIINNRYTLTSTVILRLNAGDVLQLGGLSLEDVEYTNARIDIESLLLF